jgi:hypothetical protein
LKIPKGGNQNPYIEEEQTTQWPNGNVQKDEQRSKKHTHKTKDRVTRTPLKTGDELSCFRRVSSSCSNSGTRRINLVTNPEASHIMLSLLYIVGRRICNRFVLLLHQRMDEDVF